MMGMERSYNRMPEDCRPLRFDLDFAPNALASVLASFGKTQVICAVSVQERVPHWMKMQRIEGGWLTAEYSMLPYATEDRKNRDISNGKLDGRSSEIQRLIGRSLRAVIDLKALGSRTLWVDCDVLQADGGTRTASISGASLALALACNRLVSAGKIKKNPMKQLVGAISAGVVEDTVLLDLDYQEDKAARVDFNVVLSEEGRFVELQGSGEEGTFSSDEMRSMLDFAQKGLQHVFALQRETLKRAEAPSQKALESLAGSFG